MNDKTAQAILDKVMGQVTGYQNPFSLEQFRQKYAFDVELPVQVNDSSTGEATWSQSINAGKFMTLKNARSKANVDDWLLPKQELSSIDDILRVWNQINYITTERQVDSINVAESDNIYSSENVFRTQDVIRCKNVLFCDGLMDCEYVVASQRSRNSSYSARLEDSKDCSGSFSVSWSGRIVNSFFIQDCGDLFECMFCSNIKGKKFCIANMQFDEAEYRKLKDIVVRWILTS
jgi:hypothetical protein